MIEKASSPVKLNAKIKSQNERGEICKFCKLVSLNVNDATVACDRCGDIICNNCAKLSKTECSLIRRNKTVHWYCQDCQQPALSAVKSEKMVEEKCSSMFSVFKAEMEETNKQELRKRAEMEENHKKELSLLRSELHSLRNELVEMKAHLHKTENSDYTEGKGRKEVISDLASESIRELLDRERRKLNLVWFNVPESNASDAEFITDCCAKALNVAVDITACKRLRSKDATTCRPLLVTVQDAAQVGHVLNAARKLSEFTEFNSVFVKKDATPLERANFRKKWQERLRRKNTETRVNHSHDVKITPAAHGLSEELEDK